MWVLPGPGVKPTSLALEGGFFTPEPPGKPVTVVFNQDLHALESALGYLRETGERPVAPWISWCFSRKGKTAPPANWNSFALGNDITWDITNP